MTSFQYDLYWVWGLSKLGFWSLISENLRNRICRLTAPLTTSLKVIYQIYEFTRIHIKGAGAREFINRALKLRYRGVAIRMENLLTGEGRSGANHIRAWELWVKRGVPVATPWSTDKASNPSYQFVFARTGSSQVVHCNAMTLTPHSHWIAPLYYGKAVNAKGRVILGGFAEGSVGVRVRVTSFEPLNSCITLVVISLILRSSVLILSTI